MDNWKISKKRKVFWIFTLIWTLFVYLINGEWLYFTPFIVGDILFWKTFNYTFWKERKKIKNKKKKWLGNWGDPILFAVIAATLLRTFLIEAYTIPTPSMEKSLLVGDYLFVSKVNYGPRVPMTPLSFPLVHHTLPIIGTKSYLEWIKLDYHRMSGLYSNNINIGVERNDCVVFNWPAERLERPIDKKENYIKRCVALPGDTVQIINGDLFINGKVEIEYEFMKKQRRYSIKIKKRLFAKEFNTWEDFVNLCYEEHDIYPSSFDRYSSGELKIKNGNTIEVDATKKAINDLQNKKYIKNISKAETGKNIFDQQLMDNRPAGMNPDGFIVHNPFDWDEENYGPIIVPKEGDIITLTSDNLDLYKPILKRYEGYELGNDTLFDTKEKSTQNNNSSTTYEIKQNYYWLMGDNRQNSADSRFWGYVPENHIVGKSLFIWMSYDKNGKGFRWERFKPTWISIGLIWIITLLYREMKSRKSGGLKFKRLKKESGKSLIILTIIDMFLHWVGGSLTHYLTGSNIAMIFIWILVILIALYLRGNINKILFISKK